MAWLRGYDNDMVPRQASWDHVHRYHVVWIFLYKNIYEPCIGKKSVSRFYSGRYGYEPVHDYAVWRRRDFRQHTPESEGLAVYNDPARNNNVQQLVNQQFQSTYNQMVNMVNPPPTPSVQALNPYFNSDLNSMYYNYNGKIK